VFLLKNVQLILSGGATKIPKLQQAVRELFPDAELLSGISPDEVIATGAAKQGSYLARPFDPDCEHLAMEVPAVSKPICIKVNLNTATITCTVGSFLLQVLQKTFMHNKILMSAYFMLYLQDTWKLINSCGGECMPRGDAQTSVYILMFF